MFPGILRRLFQNDGAGPLLRKDILPEIPEGTPVGTIIMFHGTSAPEGYLACTGVSFSASGAGVGHAHPVGTTRLRSGAAGGPER
jgi:hypothetical protein